MPDLGNGCHQLCQRSKLMTYNVVHVINAIVLCTERYYIAGNFEANNFHSFHDFLRFAKIKFTKIIIKNTVQNG